VGAEEEPPIELPEEALEILDEVSWPLEDPAVVGDGTAFPNPPMMGPDDLGDESISWDVSSMELSRSVLAEGEGMIAHSLQEAEVLAAAPVLSHCPPGWTDRQRALSSDLLPPDLERLHTRQQQALDRHYVRATSPRLEPAVEPPRRQLTRQPRSMADYLSYIMNPESNGAVLTPEARSRRLSELPVFRATENTEPCSICLDIGVGDQVATLACGHIYHAACIHKWLTANDDCPLCKQPAFQTHPLDGEGAD
jgi:hypothetical protein